MPPTTHLLISWVSTVGVFKNRRERALVTLAGIIPDIDGIGYVIDWLTELNGAATDYYFEYHHFFGHNVFFALLISILAALFAKSQRVAVFLVAQLCLYLHMLCDVVGSKGPDGYQWPVFIFYPLVDGYGLTWAGQWELNAWQNQITALILVMLCVYYAGAKQTTVLEVFSQRLNEKVIHMYTRRRGGGKKALK